MMRDIQVQVRGLGFPEGPVVLPDGEIAFVDLLHRKVRILRDGLVRALALLGGAPNGMRLGPDGALYIANNGGLAPVAPGRLSAADPQISGRLQRLTLDGVCTDFATNLPGGKPSRPNDLVFSDRGDVVFTDPQNWEVLKHGDPSSLAGYLGGQLLLARPDGSVTLLARTTGFPNGLAFHPDGSLLVGLTIEHRILRYPWLGDAVGEPETWCRFDDRFNPDGMVFHGNHLLVTGSVGDRIAILDAAGEMLEQIDTGPGSDPTNLCVHDDMIWVTLGLAGQLVSIRL